jgi:hypothetical protein
MRPLNSIIVGRHLTAVAVMSPMVKNPEDEEVVRTASHKDRDLSALLRVSRKRDGNSRHDRRAFSMLGHRSASVRSADCGRRASFNSAAPPRASSGTIVVRLRFHGSRHRSPATGLQVACQRSCARSLRVRAAIRGNHPLLRFLWWRLGIPFQPQLWPPTAALTISVVSRSGSAPQNRSPNPSLQRTTPGRSPGRGR